MLSIEVHFALPIVYSNAFVSLDHRDRTVVFQLKEGTHVAKSEPIDLGVVHSFEERRLLGQFSFEYTYEPERRVITVAGTHFDASGAMCLTTTPAGTVESCRQWGVGSGFRADNLTANAHWNYLTALTPGLQEVFAGLVRTVNDRMIAALEAEPQLIVQTRLDPPALSLEDQMKFLVVYHNGEFQGFHEPGRQYGPGDEVVTVNSVFGGEVTLNYGEAFANVIGSTHDPHIGGLTWIQLWANQYGTYPMICASYHSNGFPCDNNILGGHVIQGTQAKKVAKGSNSVWILPICVSHNNNDNVSMQALKWLKGVWLHNYLGS